MNKLPVITISREFGSGGRAIGEKLAKDLGIPFYNKELILMAAKESGLSEEYIKKTEQMKATSFLYGLYMGAQQLPCDHTCRAAAHKNGIEADPAFRVPQRVLRSADVDHGIAQSQHR